MTNSRSVITLLKVVDSESDNRHVLSPKKLYALVQLMDNQKLFNTRYAPTDTEKVYSFCYRVRICKGKI